MKRIILMLLVFSATSKAWGQSPPQNNLFLWMKADSGIQTSGSDVIGWKSSFPSGANAYDFQSAVASTGALFTNDPDFNGQPFIRFAPARFQAAVNFPSQTLTVFAVARQRIELFLAQPPEPLTPGFYNTLISTKGSGGFSASGFMVNTASWYASTETPVLQAERDGAGSLNNAIIRLDTANLIAGPNTPYTINKVVRISGGGASIDLPFDKPEIMEVRFGQVVATSQMTIGGTVDAGYSFNDVAEILIYTPAITDMDTLAAVEEYLALKYGVVSGGQPRASGNAPFLEGKDKNASLTKTVTAPKQDASDALEVNYPNPFNPTTSIRYSISAQTLVVLKVYDITGREVATLVNETQSAGKHDVIFNAANLASGTYFYRIKAGNFSDVKRIQLVK